LLSTAQVAAGFGVKVQTVSQWVRTGKIEPDRLANLRGDYQFSRETIEEFAKEHGLTFQDATANNVSN
jgi:predicted site-specific integrase-resolvase